MTFPRRSFLQTGAALAAGTFAPPLLAQTAGRTFAPLSGAWRAFELTIRIDLAKLDGVTKVWLSLPSVNRDYQQSLESSFSSNGDVRR